MKHSVKSMFNCILNHLLGINIYTCSCNNLSICSIMYPSYCKTVGVNLSIKIFGSAWETSVCVS